MRIDKTRTVPKYAAVITEYIQFILPLLTMKTNTSDLNLGQSKRQASPVAI